MGIKNRINYWRRIFKVYGTKEKGYLSFWHERPEISADLDPRQLGVYYQTFSDKAAYDGPKDENGVILFDYYFDIGRQYNPLAVAQYGLAHWNLYLATRENKYLDAAKVQAEWLLRNLEPNEKGIKVWKHKFRWRYKQYLEPGWFSAHAQGAGIGLLARLYKETNEKKYLDCAKEAFISLQTALEKGGVKHLDSNGDTWLEEYVVDPPTHILNGYIWGLWGVWDYYLLTGDEAAKALWDDCVATLKKNLHQYDTGFWSRYDLSRQALRMLASPFYHDLHIVQLRIMRTLSGDAFFSGYADKFAAYKNSFFKRNFALAYKALFKLVYF